MMVRAESTRFLGAAKMLVFEVHVKHGAGERRLDVAFPAEEIVKIVDVLKAHDPEHWGHAYWHYENNRPVPCSACVLPGKIVMLCKEGNCPEHKTGPDMPCYKAVDAPGGR